MALILFLMPKILAVLKARTARLVNRQFVDSTATCPRVAGTVSQWLVVLSGDVVEWGPADTQEQAATVGGGCAERTEKLRQAAPEWGSPPGVSRNDRAAGKVQVFKCWSTSRLWGGQEGGCPVESQLSPQAQAVTDSTLRRVAGPESSRRIPRQHCLGAGEPLG